jgi:hypothetical protein
LLLEKEWATINKEYIRQQDPRHNQEWKVNY